MLRFDETAALLEPIDILFSRDVILEPHRDDENEADDERKAREIMNVFGGLREAAERVWADHRQEQNFSKGYVQPRQAESDEGHGRKPMREAFECVEAMDLLSGPAGRNPQPAHNQAGASQNRDHSNDDNRAEPMQRHLVEAIPHPPRG